MTGCCWAFLRRGPRKRSIILGCGLGTSGGAGAACVGGIDTLFSNVCCCYCCCFDDYDYDYDYD